MPRLTKAVHASRANLMNALMDEEGLDALAFTTPDFFQFASNFQLDVWPWERPVLLVVPRNGEPFAIMNELSTNHMRFAQETDSVWVRDISYYSEHPRVSDRLPLFTQLPEMTAIVLREHGLAKARLGWDGGSAQLLTGAQRLLPQLTLQQAVPQLRSLRWVKHPEEQAIMRALASLTDWIQDRYRENFKPGRLVQELDHTMAGLMCQEAAKRFPGEDFEVMKCWTMSGPASASPHGDGAPCGATIKEGDTIVNLVLPRLNGYYVENERTWFCGLPSDEQAALFKIACEATNAAVDAARPGRLVCDMDAAAQAVIEKAGYAKYIFHRTGHGVGLMLHEYPEDVAFNTRQLLAGEVYSAEPGMYVYGLGGFRMDDTVIVADEPEVIVRTPKSLEYATVG